MSIVPLSRIKYLSPDFSSLSSFIQLIVGLGIPLAEQMILIGVLVSDVTLLPTDMLTGLRSLGGNVSGCWGLEMVGFCGAKTENSERKQTFKTV
jgi:hypothetical protein